ncbi:hypothetical protein BDB01DRAFT_784314 [Pilobolus umbonatus]|nr:hypothetical protein BDB01DRAFT_784314 [Pilobolus umbonatus]
MTDKIIIHNSPLLQIDGIEMSAAAFRLCTFIINELVSCYECFQFIVPVPKEATTYHDEIKTPMDFMTLELNLYANKYKVYSDFCDDLSLIWRNAMQFHRPIDHIYLQAKCLSLRFQSMDKFICGGPKPKFLSTSVKNIEAMLRVPLLEEKIQLSFQKKDHPKKSTLYFVQAIGEQNSRLRRSFSPVRHLFEQLNTPFFEYIKNGQIDTVPMPRFYVAKNRTLLQDASQDQTGSVVIMSDVKFEPWNDKNTEYFRLRATVVLATCISEIHEFDDSEMDKSLKHDYFPRAWIKLQVSKIVHDFETIINSHIHKNFFKKGYSTYRISTHTPADLKKIRNDDIATLFVQSMLEPSNDKLDPEEEKLILAGKPLNRKKVVEPLTSDENIYPTPLDTQLSAMEIEKLEKDITRTLHQIITGNTLDDTTIASHLDKMVTSLEVLPVDEIVIPKTVISLDETPESLADLVMDETPVSPKTPPMDTQISDDEEFSNSDTESESKTLIINKFKDYLSTTNIKQNKRAIRTPKKNEVIIAPTATQLDLNSMAYRSLLRIEDLNKKFTIEFKAINEELEREIRVPKRRAPPKTTIPIKKTTPPKAPIRRKTQPVVATRRRPAAVPVRRNPQKKNLSTKTSDMDELGSDDSSDSSGSSDSDSDESVTQSRNNLSFTSSSDSGSSGSSSSSSSGYSSSDSESSVSPAMPSHARYSGNNGYKKKPVGTERKKLYMTMKKKNATRDHVKSKIHGKSYLEGDMFDSHRHEIKSFREDNTEHIKAEPNTGITVQFSETYRKDVAKLLQRYTKDYTELTPALSEMIETRWENLRKFAVDKGVPVVFMKKYDAKISPYPNAEGYFKHIFFVRDDSQSVVQIFRRMTAAQRMSEIASLLYLKGKPHIGEIKEIVQDENGEIIGMTMQRYQKTLKQYAHAHSHHRLTSYQKMDIITQMLTCIDIIHKFEIAHRDLSEVNFMVNETNERFPDGTRRGEVFLIDFGKAVFTKKNDYMMWWMPFITDKNNTSIKRDPVPKREEELMIYCQHLPWIPSKPDHGYRLYRSIQTLPKSRYDHEDLSWFIHPLAEDIYSIGTIIWKTFADTEPWYGILDTDLKGLRETVGDDYQIERTLCREVPGKMSRELLFKFLKVLPENRKSAADALRWLSYPDIRKRLMNEWQTYAPVGRKRRHAKDLDKLDQESANPKRRHSHTSVKKKKKKHSKRRRTIISDSSLDSDSSSTSSDSSSSSSSMHHRPKYHL